MSFIRSRSALAGLVTVTLVAAFAQPAHSAWSPAGSVPNSADVGWPAIAVNESGDVVIAWVQAGQDGPGAAGRTSAVVRVAVGRPGGDIRTHTLVSVPDRKVAHMTVALDRFGEPTVAWVEQLQENRNRSSVVDRIRAVFRRPSGHWSAIQVLGRSSAFINASPRVASAPDGTVALTYYAGSAHPGAMAVAWRSRGHVFGAPRTLGGEFLTDPALAFDSAGTMYLAGTRRCDAASRAVLYRATTAKRRQPDVWLIGKAPVTGVALGVTGKGSVALGWVAAACGGENPLGTPTGTTVDGSKIAAIRNLGAGGATNMTVAGSDVSWANPPSSAPPSGAVLTTRLASAAPAADPHAPAGGWVAVAADGGGDRLVRQVQPASAVNDPVGALPAGGSSVAPAPLSLSGWPWNAGAAAAAYGRGLALLTVSPPGRPPGLVTAAWRP